MLVFIEKKRHLQVDQVLRPVLVVQQRPSQGLCLLWRQREDLVDLVGLVNQVGPAERGTGGGGTV